MVFVVASLSPSPSSSSSRWQSPAYAARLVSSILVVASKSVSDSLDSRQKCSFEGSFGSLPPLHTGERVGSPAIPVVLICQISQVATRKLSQKLLASSYIRLF